MSAGLILYWTIPLILAAGYGINEPSKARIVTAVISYAIGVCIMLVSDC